MKIIFPLTAIILLLISLAKTSYSIYLASTEKEKVIYPSYKNRSDPIIQYKAPGKWLASSITSSIFLIIIITVIYASYKDKINIPKKA